MISIGLTTWSDHPALVNDTKPAISLVEYAAVLPVVEVDMPFYKIPDPSTVVNWQHQVPANFQFILKAHQWMTKHDLAHEPVDETKRSDAFDDYLKALRPLIKANQLKTVLFQFPPFFRRTTENIQWLMEVRRRMGRVPIAVEFRHGSWFESSVVDSVLDYLTCLKITNVIVDEPHRVNDGVPMIAQVTTPTLAMFRLHGRNEAGWFNRGPQWRAKRTLYRYSESELQELAGTVNNLTHSAKEVCVIFNNNSGHDAAPNALALRDLLGLSWAGLGHQQLSLF